MDPTTLAQYNAQLPTSISAIQETAGGSNLGLQNYFSTPSAALNYGQAGANSMATAAGNGTYNPITAFQNSDPSYQYQINQAMQNVNNQSAAHGLLESGATQQDLLSTSQNLQNTQYQNWLGQQNSLFGNYQTQLGNLATAGLATNGATQANSNANTLAGLTSTNDTTAATNIGNANVSTGSSLSNANLGTSSNISQLLQALGINNASMYENTGAAVSNNIFNGNQFQAQIDSEIMNQNAQSAGASAASNGLGGSSGGGSSTAGNAAGTGFNGGPGTVTNFGNGNSTYTGTGGF